MVIFLNFQLEIVGLNRKNYETRRRVVHMNVQEKPGKEIVFFFLIMLFPALNVKQRVESGICRDWKLSNLFVWSDGFYPLSSKCLQLESR
jgi:hypothetical protein